LWAFSFESYDGTELIQVKNNVEESYFGIADLKKVPKFHSKFIEFTIN
ncbi:9704_t:CDS:1, partial [Gigaspora margarita]